MAALVEFFGLPGSGKSTVTNAIERGPGVHSRHEIAKDWRRPSHLRRVCFTIRTLLDVPLMLAALRLAHNARLTSRESYGRLVRLVFMKHWWIAQPGLLLLDQGALQSVWSIVYASDRSNPSPAAIDALLRAFFNGMLANIVLLEVDEATAMQRIIDRKHGNSRLDDLPWSEVKHQLARSMALFQTIVDAGRTAGLTFHRFDGSSPVAILAEQLRELLAQVDCEANGDVG